MLEQQSRQLRWSTIDMNTSCAANSAGLCARPRASYRRAADVPEADIHRLTLWVYDYLRNEKYTSTELHQWVRKNYFSFRCWN